MNNQSNSDSIAKPNNNIKATMFHDGECPLCQFEVKTMKKLDINNAIHWVDINKDYKALEKAGINYQDAMSKIHVLDETQTMLTGVRGFLAVWQHLPYYRILVPIIKHVPLLLPLTESLYRVFAKIRLLLKRTKE